MLLIGERSSTIVMTLQNMEFRLQEHAISHDLDDDTMETTHARCFKHFRLTCRSLSGFSGHQTGPTHNVEATSARL